MCNSHYYVYVALTNPPIVSSSYIRSTQLMASLNSSIIVAFRIDSWIWSCPVIKGNAQIQIFSEKFSPARRWTCKWSSVFEAELCVGPRSKSGCSKLIRYNWVKLIKIKYNITVVQGEQVWMLKTNSVNSAKSFWPQWTNWTCAFLLQSHLSAA